MCLLIKRLGRAFVSKHAAEPLEQLELCRAFKGLTENQKLGLEFEKLGQVFEKLGRVLIS